MASSEASRESPSGSRSRNIFGLTGGIATGKSTVARFLKQRGVAVIDADELARKIVAPGSVALQRIGQEFGPEIIEEDGTLNRIRLGKIVFESPDRRRQLESILHPLIDQLAQQRASEFLSEGYPVVAYEAAVMIEAGQQEAYRPLVVTTCKQSTQRERLMRRDHLDSSEAQQRLEAQMPLEQKVSLADYVIETDGTLDQVQERTNRVLHDLAKTMGIALAG